MPRVPQGKAKRGSGASRGSSASRGGQGASKRAPVVEAEAGTRARRGTRGQRETASSMEDAAVQRDANEEAQGSASQHDSITISEKEDGDGSDDVDEAGEGSQQAVAATRSPGGAPASGRSEAHIQAFTPDDGAEKTTRSSGTVAEASSTPSARALRPSGSSNTTTATAAASTSPRTPQVEVGPEASSAVAASTPTRSAGRSRYALPGSGESRIHGRQLSDLVKNQQHTFRASGLRRSIHVPSLHMKRGEPKPMRESRALGADAKKKKRGKTGDEDSDEERERVARRQQMLANETPEQRRRRLVREMDEAYDPGADGGSQEEVQGWHGDGDVPQDMEA